MDAFPGIPLIALFADLLLGVLGGLLVSTFSKTLTRILGFAIIAIQVDKSSGVAVR